MDLPVGLLDVMDDVIRDENRRNRRDAAAAKAHRRR
jgi:hypothetical protein